MSAIDDEDGATVPLDGVAEPNLARRRVALDVFEGPDAGASFTIDLDGGARVLIGQSPVCDIRLSDRRCSRRHAALELSGSRVKLTDLGSSNGTSVEGVRVMECFLRSGDTIRLGVSAMRVGLASSETRPPTGGVTRFGRVVGRSASMQRLYPLCERLAATDVPVIIEGETGTGKELLAESLHESGPRASGAFVVFDCTAVAPSLMESELFGHERGAFTGAVEARKGVFELAHGGTLLIDEIGDLDLSLQPKLLRVLERSEVRRVGGTRTIPVDVRLIAATRRDLDQAVQDVRFRDDLFHRLAVARLELPPLRRRKGDVELLATHFWVSMGGEPGALDDALLRRFEEHTWPGNVRELRNAVARRIALGDLEALIPAPGSGTRAATDFFEQMLAKDLPFIPARQAVVDEFERRYVERVLARHAGNVSRAAAASGIARRTMQILRGRSTR